MPDVLEELIRRTNKLEREVEELRARERFIGRDYDYLRGWKDDFMGKSLHEQYNLFINGVDSTISLSNQVGGAVKMLAGAGAGRWALLELGDSAGGYEPLDADQGWVQIAYGRLNNTTDIYTGLYAWNAGGAELLLTGLRTDVVANNWIIRANDGVAFAHTDTGVAADTTNHLHVQHVYPTAAGHQIDYWLDGRIIGSQTTRIPTVRLAPGLLSYTVAGTATRIFLVDFWNVIPRNL